MLTTQPGQKAHKTQHQQEGCPTLLTMPQMQEKYPILDNKMSVTSIGRFSSLLTINVTKDQKEMSPVRAGQTETSPMAAGQKEAAPVRAGQTKTLPVRASQTDKLPARAGQTETSPVRAGQTETSPVRAGWMETSTLRAGQMETSPVTACHMETSSVRAGQAEKPIRAGWVKLVPSYVPEKMGINDSGIDLEGRYLYRTLQCFMKGTYILLNIIMVIKRLSVLLTNNDKNNNNNNNNNNDNEGE